MKRKKDLRVIRTKKMILEAFFSLVEEKGYEAVRIQEIAKRAMINRATFYAHFKDKDDLYEYIFDLAIDAFISVLDQETAIQKGHLNVKYVETLLTKIYQNIQKNQNFFLTVIDHRSNELLRKKLEEILYVKYADTFSLLKITENDIEVPIDFIIEYMTSIFVGTLRWWITSQTEMKPNDLARLVIKLVGNGHLTVLGIQIEK